MQILLKQHKCYLIILNSTKGIAGELAIKWCETMAGEIFMAISIKSSKGGTTGTVGSAFSDDKQVDSSPNIKQTH